MEHGYEKTGHYPWFIPSHSHRRLLIRVSDGTEFSQLMSNPMRFQGRQSKERTAAQVTTNDFSPWFPLLNNPFRNKTKLRDELVENSFFHAFFYLTKLILSRFGCISKCLGSLFFNLVPYKEVKVIHNVVFSSFSSLSLYSWLYDRSVTFWILFGVQGISFSLITWNHQPVLCVVSFNFSFKSIKSFLGILELREHTASLTSSDIKLQVPV